MSPPDGLEPDPGVVIEASDWGRLPSNPVVSVLMCAYNHEPYLDDAIKGVLMQETDFPVELLIGEDCSTDGTRAIALAYQARYPHLVRVVTSTANVGNALNIKRILDRSRGRFIAFCEGDDYWCQATKLQDQVDILSARPEVTAVFADFAVADLRDGCWRVDYSNTAFGDLRPEELRGDVFDRCLDGRLRTLTAVYRREVMDAVYRKRLPRDEYPFGDNFWRAQAAVMGQFDRVDGVRAVYRRAPGSVTRSDARRNLAFLQACRRFNSHFPSYFPERAPGPSFDLAVDDLLICRAAVAAMDRPAFDEAYDRLARAGRVPVVLRWARGLMRVPVLLRLVLLLRAELRRRRYFSRGD